MFSEYELDIRLCIDLLKEYNQRSDSEHFNIERCEQDLRKSDHEKVKKYLNDIKELIYKQDFRDAADKLIEETKLYGVEWVKEKYGLNSLDKKEQWLLNHGFTKEYCSHRECTTYNYKGYSWTMKEVKYARLTKLFVYKQWYDGIITEEFLNKIIKKLEEK